MSLQLSLECSSLEFILTCVYSVTAFILLPTAIYAFCRFIQNFQQRAAQNKASKQLFYIGLVFIVLSFLSLIGLPIGWRGSVCFDDYSFVFGFKFMFINVYELQMYLLLLILYYRLYYVFRDTELAISNTISTIYITLFCISPLYMSIIAIYGPICGFDNDDKLFIILVSVGYIMMDLIAISLSILFVRKLFEAFKLDSSNINDRLLSTLTKNTILSIVSTLCTFIVPVFVLIDFAFNMTIKNYDDSGMGETFKYLRDCGLLLDTYTNLVCVMMSYAFFNNIYKKLCGYLDNQCQVYWKQKVNRNDPTELEILRSGSN